MTLDVKSRIGIAMTAVVAINLVAAGAVWWLNASAARHAQDATHAAAKAVWVSTASGAITEFISESNDLVLGFSAEDTSESSAEYGDVMGKDLDIANLLDGAPADVTPNEIDSIVDTWMTLRNGVFVWANTEAEAAGSATRLTINEDGKVRASVQTNIVVPTELAVLGRTELRREIRSQEEAFRDGLLRNIQRDAIAASDEAQALAMATRQRATTYTLALIGIGFLTAIAASAWLYGTIASPLKRARHVAEQVAAGHLDAQFPDHSDDEIGALVLAVEKMRDSVVGKVMIMREMAGVLIVTAEGVGDAAEHAREITDEHANPELQMVLEEVGRRASTLEELSAQMLQA